MSPDTMVYAKKTATPTSRPWYASAKLPCQKFGLALLEVHQQCFLFY